MKTTSTSLLTSTNDKLLKALLVIISSSLLVAMFVPTNILMFILFSWRIQLLLLLSLMIFFNSRNEILYALAIGSFYISPLVSYVYFNVANAPILIGLSLSVMLITICVNYLVMDEKHSLNTMTKNSALSRHGKSNLILFFILWVGLFICWMVLLYFPSLNFVITKTAAITALLTMSLTWLAIQMIYLKALNILFDGNNQTKNNKAPSVAAMSLFADPLNILTKQQTFKDNVFTRLVKLIWSILTQVFEIPASVFYYFRYKLHSDLPLEDVPEAVKLDHPEICLAAVRQNWRALLYVPQAVKLDHPEMCLAAVRQNWRALQYVPKYLRNENLYLAALEKMGSILLLHECPEELKKDEKLCLAAVQQDEWALEYVPEAVKLAHPEICLAAVKKRWNDLKSSVEEGAFVIERDNKEHKEWCEKEVPKSLKTNIDALAKLYTTSEAQLRADLTLLQINGDVIRQVINQVICAQTQIAKSSSMIEQLLGTGNDSKQTAEHPVNSRDIIPAALLPMIQEYVYTPPISENDAKESKGLSPL